MPPEPLPLAPLDTCSTCANILPPTPPVASPSPPPAALPRRLPCCARLICAACLARNPRFRTYCPFCQLSSAASVLGAAEVGEPPGYSPRAVGGGLGKERGVGVGDEDGDGDGDVDGGQLQQQQPPAYTAYAVETQQAVMAQQRPQQHEQQQDDGDSGDDDDDDEVHGREREQIHYLRPDDSIASLALRYGVPAAVLRTHNRIGADSLLQARRSILIPSTHYSGLSLSPTSLLGAEEEERQRAVRRFMVATKVVDEGVARVYLDGAGGVVGRAVERYRADERWEAGHPLMVVKRGRGGREVRGLDQGR